MIADHFVKSLQPRQAVQTITSEITIGNTVLETTETIDPDFEQNMLTEKAQVRVADAEVVQKLHYNKNYITFSDLLSKMEQNRIGTDATVAEHISGLNAKGYVQIVDQNHMKPNELGNAIVEAV